jgi:hypothetical protein
MSGAGQEASNDVVVAPHPLLHWGLIAGWTLAWFATEPGLVVLAKSGLSQHSALGWLPLLVLLFYQFGASALLGMALSWRLDTGRHHEGGARVLVPNVLNALNFAAQATQMGALLFGSLSFTQIPPLLVTGVRRACEHAHQHILGFTAHLCGRSCLRHDGA